VRDQVEGIDAREVVLGRADRRQVEREDEKLQGLGLTIPQACKRIGISDQTVNGHPSTDQLAATFNGSLVVYRDITPAPLTKRWRPPSNLRPAAYSNGGMSSVGPGHELTPSGMPRRISNPEIGDVLTFVKVAAETAGERVVVEITLAPRGGNPMHIHLRQTETFKIVDGELNVTIAAATRRLKEGDEATVPPRTPHRFFSDSNRPVTFRVTINHPGGVEDGLRILYGLARDGKAPGGLPRNPLAIALCAQQSDIYGVGLPLWFQRALVRAVAALASALRYDRRLAVYVRRSVGA
jgi:mannose-6-phosphate isomerase-like protein (cupin superfamily)